MDGSSAICLRLLRDMLYVVCLSVLQGRVWTGRQALQRGLVDALGGVYAAVQLVRQEAGIAADEKVSVVEVGTGRTSPLALLRGER